jgi:hypothetical protein
MVRQVLAYEEWEQTVPEEIKSDSVWRMQAYRLALYAADIGWEDVVLLARDRRTIGIAEQLFRSLGSISANLAEGYSEAANETKRGFTNMPSVQRGKHEIGISRLAMCWVQRLFVSALVC